MTDEVAGTGYSEEQLAIQRVVRDFARKEVAPGAEERDRTGAFDYSLYRRLGDLGLTGVLFPEEYGGSAADTIFFCLLLQELSRVDMSLGITLRVGVMGARSIVSGGTDEQLGRWLEPWVLPTVRGDAVSAGAITRTRRRLRYRRHSHLRCPGGERVGDQRLEDLHHQRGLGAVPVRDGALSQS